MSDSVNKLKFPDGFTPEQKEIMRGNHVIAFFVGLEIKTWNACFSPPINYMEGEFLIKVRREPNYADLINRENRATVLAFHAFMDWLIPAFTIFRNLVVDKILVQEKERREADILSSIADDDINNAFLKLVKHIKWYNRSVSNG